MILFRKEVKNFLNDIKEILNELHENKISVDEAYLKLKEKPFEDIGYAKVDLHRKIRQGASEVIYGAGKTPEQIAGIINVMKEHHQGAILITRLSPESAEKLKSLGCEINYYASSHAGIYGTMPEPQGKNFIVVATGGTSDIPVAEEAALTAEVLGNKVKRLYDVGVSGLHRVLSNIDEIMSASVIVAVAGMTTFPSRLLFAFFRMMFPSFVSYSKSLYQSAAGSFHACNSDNNTRAHNFINIR